MFDQDGDILQAENYYPFGMLMKGFDGYNNWDNENKYLYNGKELQDDFGLDWYDYGARFFDPQLGRWHVVDNLAEKYSSFSPYNYGINNPVRYIDPDGNGIFDEIVKAATNYVANAASNFTKHMASYVGDQVNEVRNNIEVSGYAKADGKVTIGARSAAETEDGTGYDVNIASISVISGSIEVDKNGVQKDGSLVGVTDNTESTRGASYGQFVGTIGSVPISANTGYSEEYQVVGGETTQTKKEVSASPSVTGTPLGVFTSIEHTENSRGGNSTVLRVAPVNYGVTYGTFVVGQFSVSVGFKVEYRKDEE